MARWKGQARGGASGHRIFLFILRRSGLRPAYFLLAFVTFYFCIFSKGASRASYFYFRRIHGYSPLRSIISIYRNYYAFGQTMLDKYAMLAGAANGKFSYTHENGDHLDRLVQEGEGAILLSAHIGNWDMAGHLLKRLEGRINVVMYENEKEQVKQVLDPILGQRSFNIIGVGEGMEHLIEIREALARGEFVCMHADRYREGVKTVDTDLMGKRTRLPLGPFMLATKLEAPVCFVFSCKDSTWHYRFYTSPPHKYEAQRGVPQEKVIEPVLRDYLEELERFMKAYPLQWYNFFPFWLEELSDPSKEEDQGEEEEMKKAPSH